MARKVLVRLMDILAHIVDKKNVFSIFYAACCLLLCKWRMSRVYWPTFRESRKHSVANIPKGLIFKSSVNIIMSG